MFAKEWVRPFVYGLLCLTLAACGGGSDSTSQSTSSSSSSVSSSSSSSSSSSVSSAPTYTVGGTVSGLSGSVVLRLNGASNLTVSASGAFTFSSAPLANTASYVVSVFTQPANQICTVSGGSGAVNSANVTNVAVTCVNAYSVSGTVSGLTASGLVLQLNAGNDLSIASGATTFAFTAQVASGTAYAVSVLTQPAGKLCTLVNATGTISANVSNVTITCVNAYTVGGTITGLTASGLKLTLLNATTGAQIEEVAVASGSTSFTFVTTFTAATQISATISNTNQPASLTCILGSPGAQAGTANVSSIQVACAPKSTNVLQGTYSVGAANTGTPAFFTFYSNGSYVFGHHDSGQTDVEYGIYNWNATTGTVTVPVLLTDTADSGLTDLHDGLITIEIAISGLNLVATVHENGINSTVTLYPVTNTSGSLVGVWSGPYPRDVLIYLSDGTFMATITSLSPALNSFNSPNLYNGLENACYTAGSNTLTHTVTSCIVDTSNSLPGINANGNVGLINNTGTQPTWSYSVSGDTLTRTSNVTGGVTQTLTRVP